MSTRTYNLRTRTDAGVADQQRAPTVSNATQAATPLSRDLPPHMLEGHTSPGRPAALYSEVVASRSPSPVKEASSTTLSRPVGEPDGGKAPAGDSGPMIRIIPTESRDINVEKRTSNEENISPEDPGDEPCTTVRRQRARSLESFDPVLSYSRSPSAKGLTPDQVHAVKVAAEALTQSQKHTLTKRHERVTRQRKDSSSSRGEGASRPKGKGIDPREWENVNISQESLDIDAQAAAWKSLAHGQKTDKQTDLRKGETDRCTPHRDYRSQSAQLPAASRPVAQLAQDSYLWMALRNVDRSSSDRPYRPRRRESPSSSDPSSSSEENTGSETDSSSSEESHRRRNNKHGRNGRRRKRSSHASSKLVIKPIAPKEYDGSANSRAYHCFVRESEAYLRDGKVKGQRKIFLLSYYLTGKAYDFYTQKVANDKVNWTLGQFYDELFNYCFLVDYRMQLR